MYHANTCSIAGASAIDSSREIYVPDSYWKQAILHVDANYFYAQVETLRYPQLLGKPVAVVGNEGP